jgi:hypothetical protein
MNEIVKITIEEWANNNDVNINNNQIKELVEAIDMCSEMNLNSIGFTLGHNTKSDEDKKIEILENKLRTLELFISSKGYSIGYEPGYVTEYYMEKISDTHIASNRRTTKLF